jgi:transcription elongation factor SPT5
MQRIFSAGPSTPSGIRSVLGRPSYPGAIFVEATHVEAVYEACAGLTYAKPQDTQKIPASDAHQYLRARETYIPRSPGWVRLTKGRYRGDTAYVRNVTHSLDTELLVIPRISLDVLKKRKTYSHVPQALFNANTISPHFKVEQHNQALVCRGDTYLDGFLVMDADGSEFEHYDALPNREELQLFRQSQTIPEQFILATFNALDSATFQPGHRVLIVSGSFQGQPGTIDSILPHSARVRIPILDLCPDIDYRELRKDIRVGDYVRVLSGPNVDFTGWVVSVETAGDTIIFDHHSNKEVCNVNLPAPPLYVLLDKGACRQCGVLVLNSHCTRGRTF